MVSGWLACFCKKYSPHGSLLVIFFVLLNLSCWKKNYDNNSIVIRALMCFFPLLSRAYFIFYRKKILFQIAINIIFFNHNIYRVCNFPVLMFLRILLKLHYCRKEDFIVPVNADCIRGCFLLKRKRQICLFWMISVIIQQRYVNLLTLWLYPLFVH